MEVNMWRRILPTILAAAVVFGAATTAAAQSKAAKIAQAMAAGPASITKNATIKDWPDKDGKMAVLREGSNGWVCVPSEPQTQYLKNDAMCMDPMWQEFMAALIEQRAPKITQIGYAYMLTTNAWGSNTDMMAKAPTADNQWHKQGPHVMLVYPDAALLAGIPTRPSISGAYVMAPGTPYAHVMWPVK
jgi:hypothetical protein